MRPFGTLIPFKEAKGITGANIEPITRTEAVGIDDCLDRVLAEDIVATQSTPPFNRAAMDGYALKSGDTLSVSPKNPGLLNIIDVLHAGSVPTKRVSQGECIQIATGAIIPPGADAVVKIEDVIKENSQIKVKGPVKVKNHVALMGEDIKKGELVLKRGILLSPAKIGVLASQGMSRVRVYERPRVSIIPTGEEVAEVGKRLSRGQVYDINSYTLSSLVKRNGCRPLKSNIVSDDIRKIKATLDEALKSDLVVISGGSSVGEKDLLFGVLKEWGQVLFHGVRIKPGRPVMFALVRGKPVLGLPGYPTSCLMDAYLFLEPALRKMAHLAPKRGTTITTKLVQKVVGSAGLRQFLPVRLEASGAQPIFKGSGAITSTAQADGYIVLAEDSDPLEKGEAVSVTLF